MSIRRSFRNLPVDRKFALVFAIALVVMLAVSLLVSSLTLGSYDRRLYSYEQGRLNSVMEMIVSRVDEIDSLSYSVAMDASLQDQLYALQDASTTLYRYGMMDVYSQLVALLLNSTLTENFIILDDRITEYRTVEAALELEDSVLETFCEEVREGAGALVIHQPEPGDDYLLTGRLIRHYRNADLRTLGMLIFITPFNTIAGPVSGEDDSSMRPEGNGVGEDVVLMKNVSVRLGDTAIVENMDWEVHRGEKWALTGPNGSGKSTLLSLVCGDNPQAYRNDISIFGRRRGTGESIWDIKKRIGYLSPDMHTYYLEDISCLDVAASGFFDSIGLSGHCSDEQYRMAEAWMRCFRAENLMSRSFMKISYGEQRLVLLVRAFVKNPELLILDEPLHGLDTGKKSLALKVIGEFCSDPRKTMIYVSHYKDEIPSCVNCFKTLSRN